MAKKSIFQEKLKKGFEKKHDQGLPLEMRKEKRLVQLEKIFDKLGNKENRYIFYCPDIPFPLSTVKVIYEYAKLMQDAGYNTLVLHDVKGFKPSWFQEEWVATDIKSDGLSKKEKDSYSKSEFAFDPTDTIIIPDGFWTVMQGFVEAKGLHKVVLVLGYGGMTAVEPGLDWGVLGFNDVVCVSEELKEDYKNIWPHLNYYVAPYTLSINGIEEYKKPISERTPTIGLSIRNREEAQQLINIFYSKYPYLDMFQFKIMKKLNTNDYLDSLSRLALLVLIDANAGCPAQSLEATALDIPVLATYGRGFRKISDQTDGLYFTPTDNGHDLFSMAEQMATFCFTWLDSPTPIVVDKSMLEIHKTENVRLALNEVAGALQQEKVKKFATIKQAVEDGKLDEATFEGENTVEEEVKEEFESKLEVVKS